MQKEVPKMKQWALSKWESSRAGGRGKAGLGA